MPVYLSDYTLSEQIRSELGFLYKRGFIEIVESTIYFSHPTYREAARYLILNNNPDIDQKIDKLVLKILACLNDRTAGVCAKQWQFYYKNIVSKELKEVFKNYAFDAAHLSIFPSVRDICFIFLLEFLSDFDETRIDRILEMVGSGLPTGDIFWENDVPFISDALNFLTDDDEFELEDVKSYLEDLKEGKSISVYNTWHIVLYLNKKDCDMSLFPGYGGCLQILNSDEAFIRAKMAFVILKSNPSADSRIFNTIFKDSHPSVIFEAIKGAFYGYPYYTDEQKDLIVPLLVNSMNDELVIIRSNNLISTFGLDYGNECIDWESVPEESKKPMWNLWTLLFPIVYSKMPDKVFISNSGRMGASMNASVNYIDSESGLNIATIFFEWIDRRLSAEHSLDTHELSVLSYLLESTDKGEERFMLFKRVFTHPSTDFVTYSLSWCVSMWDLLNSQEVEFILDLLYSDRIDCRWLRAVSITQKSIPKEIQDKIFQNDDLFSLECSDIVAGIEDQLLEDAITLFCGEPHPISWLGLNHIGRENWYPIVKWVLINKHAVGFNQALKEMVVSYANGPAPDWKDDGLAIWTALCAGDKQDVLADRLIRETARCNCSIEPTQKMWHALIDSYTDETIDKLVAMVLDGLEAMQHYDSDDILHFFDRKFLETYILPSSPMDQDLILISIELDKRRSGYEDRVGKLIKLALESYAVIPVRLQVTFDIISKAIDKHSLDYPDLKKFKDIPNNVDKVGDEWLKHRNEHYILPDWSFYKKIN
ncbi:MAG: hypothetical protein EOO43_05680 [Flavobacterium sp.]|nr:MAG: hypothetical protein EOO43_05680 [Flavobacterium sp.]